MCADVWRLTVPVMALQRKIADDSEVEEKGTGRESRKTWQEWMNIGLSGDFVLIKTGRQLHSSIGVALRRSGKARGMPK